MSSHTGWTRTQDKKPPKDVTLDVLLSDSKTESKLIFDGKIYWTADYTMYVHYVPTWWKVSGV